MSTNDKATIITLVVVAVLSAFASGYLWGSWVANRPRYKRKSNLG